MNFVFFSTANDSVTAPNLGLGNVYVETAAVIGHDVITGFNPAADILELSHSAFGTVANVLAVTSTVSGGALITINSGASIALPGVAPSTLNAQNIQLV
jgi:hypothetical protein